MLTENQRSRIAAERIAVEKYFPSFIFHSYRGKCYWIGEMKTNAGNTYTIRVEIPDDYPDVRPNLYIIKPFPLYTYNGTKLSELGATHSMHTFSPKNDWVQMCIFRDERWSAVYTVFKCLKKARIWVERFDEHRRTGKTMSELLGTQE